MDIVTPSSSADELDRTRVPNVVEQLKSELAKTNKKVADMSEAIQLILEHVSNSAQHKEKEKDTSANAQPKSAIVRVRGASWGPPLPPPRVANGPNSRSNGPINNRGRSVSRAAAAKKSNHPNVQNVRQNKTESYATALAQAKRKADTIRNIYITVENDEQASEIMSKLVKHKRIVDLGNLVRVKRKSARHLTVTMRDAESAAKIDEILSEEFGEAVSTAQPEKKKHMIRITGLDTEYDEDPDFLIENLKSSNSLLQKGNIEYIRHYDVNGRRSYRNLIIAVDPVTQAKIMQDGKLFYGLSSKRAHEYIDDIICKNCWRHGHFKPGCTFPVACKRCGGGHSETECTEEKYTCINCKRQNSSNKTKLSIHHRVTDDRCPVSLNRIEEIKKSLAKN